MIKIRHKGNFSKTTKFFERVRESVHKGNFDRFGREGVAALASATPVESGETANAWYYQIEIKKNTVRITFCNSNVQNGIPVAILLQYGHATKNGGFVEGRDYINPAIQPIFDKIADEAWREVTKL